MEGKYYTHKLRYCKPWESTAKLRSKMTSMTSPTTLGETPKPDYISPIQFVFDVESIGLHGEPFAVGWVVYQDGKLIEESYFACDPNSVHGCNDDRQWIAENCPALPVTHISLDAMLVDFWKAWMAWKEKGAQMFAECLWPVEGKFLSMCIGTDYPRSKWDGPYPIHEIASLMAAAGINPMGTYERKDDEAKHHPLGDARQSGRLLQQALTTLASAELTTLRAQVRELSEWHPIATAPKDGSPVLAIIEGSDTPYAIFFGGKGNDETVGDNVGNCWRMSWDFTALNEPGDRPLFWMRLPALASTQPSEEKQVEGEDLEGENFCLCGHAVGRAKYCPKCQPSEEVQS